MTSAGHFMILVIGEQRGGALNRATWEAMAGAQELAAAGTADHAVLLLGAGLAAAAAELAPRRCTR